MWRWPGSAARDEQARQLRLVNAQLALVRRLLLQLVRPLRPYGLQVTLLQETHTMGAEDTLVFSVAAAPLNKPHDVVQRHCNVRVNGAEHVHLTTDPDANKFADISVPEGASVNLVFIDVDDANNESAPLSYDFIAADRIPPEQPAGVAIAPVAEVPGDEYTG